MYDNTNIQQATSCRTEAPAVIKHLAKIKELKMNARDIAVNFSHFDYQYSEVAGDNNIVPEYVYHNVAAYYTLCIADKQYDLAYCSGMQYECEQSCAPSNSIEFDDFNSDEMLKKIECLFEDDIDDNFDLCSDAVKEIITEYELNAAEVYNILMLIRDTAAKLDTFKILKDLTNEEHTENLDDYIVERHCERIDPAYNNLALKKKELYDIEAVINARAEFLDATNAEYYVTVKCEHAVQHDNHVLNVTLQSAIDDIAECDEDERCTLHDIHVKIEEQLYATLTEEQQARRQDAREFYVKFA